MTIIIKTICKQGKLILTDTHVMTEGITGRQSMLRSSVTGVSYKMTIPSLFGLGGAGNMIFHGQGTEALVADTVGRKNAHKIMEMLGY